jgi:hypothetical protein
MADGGTPIEQQVADAEALAAQLPELTRTAAALDELVTAADLAHTHARAAWGRAHDDATAARLPHLRAWGTLATLRYRSTRDAARKAEDDAASAVAQALQELEARRRERENLQARTSRVLHCPASDRPVDSSCCVPRAIRSRPRSMSSMPIWRAPRTGSVS